MSWLSGLSSVVETVGVATQAAGVAASFYGAQQQADALRGQAPAIQDLSEEERAFVLEQSQLEAELLEKQGLDQIEVLQFNQGVARENASWELQAGEVAFNQARRQWQAKVSDTVARFAASGARLDGTTNDFILSQVGEMEEDLFLIGLNSERAAKQEEQRAELFGVQERQTRENTAAQIAARLRVGELEADAVGTAASARASAARTSARTASIQGFGNLFRGGASVLSDFADTGAFD